jgi:hypothetical protein
MVAAVLIAVINGADAQGDLTRALCVELGVAPVPQQRAM